jgi:hypothetical protein
VRHDALRSRHEHMLRAWRRRRRRLPLLARYHRRLLDGLGNVPLPTKERLFGEQRVLWYVRSAGGYGPDPMPGRSVSGGAALQDQRRVPESAAVYFADMSGWRASAAVRDSVDSRLHSALRQSVSALRRFVRISCNCGDDSFTRRAKSGLI